MYIYNEYNEGRCVRIFYMRNVNILSARSRELSLA